MTGTRPRKRIEEEKLYEGCPLFFTYQVIKNGTHGIQTLAMAFHAYLLFSATTTKPGIVPPAEWCLPSPYLKELSGCIAMTDKEAECGIKGSEDEKLDCYCTQEMARIPHVRPAVRRQDQAMAFGV